MTAQQSTTKVDINYPKLPEPKYSRIVDGLPCITIYEHQHLMRAYVDADRVMRAALNHVGFFHTHPTCPQGELVSLRECLAPADIRDGWQEEPVFLVDLAMRAQAAPTLQADSQPAPAEQQAAPKAAPVAVAGPSEAETIIRALLDHIERNTCEHHETYRGGAIWEICSACGAKWADDEGGKPTFEWPAPVERAREFLLAAPTTQVAPGEPMQEFEKWLATYSTLSAARDVNGYADLTTEMLWHAWQAAAKTKAPEGASAEWIDANARPGLALTNCTCAHDFSVQPSSGIRLCQKCRISETAARK